MAALETSSESSLAPMTTPATLPNLSADAITIGYPRRTLATDISFGINSGAALAILGPNGSGKTTLFRTLLGLLPVKAGNLTIGGRDISHMSPPDIARQIAYVPQITSGFFNFNVIEVLEMARAPHLAWYAKPGPHDREIAMRALAQLNIAEFAYREFAELSGGERQLVMVARALASEARIILLDEPTASLDFGNRLMILDTIVKLKHAGVAIIFATHDPDQAYRICGDSTDSTMTISRTGKFSIGASTNLLTKSALAALYGVAESAIPAFHL
ncbi:MAG: ABC transporter ATP-binding protein [Pseudomonadota bacterium]